MYAMRIRKTDLPVLTLLNGGITLEVPAKGTHYLLVTPRVGGGTESQVITEKEYDTTYAPKISATGPTLVKLNKN